MPFAIPTTAGPLRYASYNGSTTRRNLDQQALPRFTPALQTSPIVN